MQNVNYEPRESTVNCIAKNRATIQLIPAQDSVKKTQNAEHDSDTQREIEQQTTRSMTETANHHSQQYKII